MLSTLEGEIYIDPYANGQKDFFISYFTKDYISQAAGSRNLSCGLDGGSITEIPEGWHPSQSKTRSVNSSDPVEMRVYRLAIGATGEWTQYSRRNEGIRFGRY